MSETKIGIGIMRADGVVQTLSEVKVPDFYDLKLAKQTKVGLIFKKNSATGFIKLEKVV